MAVVDRVARILVVAEEATAVVVEMVVMAASMAPRVVSSRVAPLPRCGTRVLIAMALMSACVAMPGRFLRNISR